MIREKQSPNPLKSTPKISGRFLSFARSYNASFNLIKWLKAE